MKRLLATLCIVACLLPTGLSAMILLTATTSSVEVVLSGAVTTNQLPFTASFVDVTTTTFTPGSNNGASNNTTAVTMVAAPGASTQRQVKFLSVYNADTVAATVTIQYNANSTLRTIAKTTLAVGSTLFYTDGQGFYVVNASGQLETAAAGGTITLDGDVTGTGSGTITTTIAANSVALGTDTTNNYVASANTSVLTGLTGGSAGSEGAALTLGLDYSQALSGDVGLAANNCVFGVSGWVCEGATANTIEMFIAVPDPVTSDKTITFPNATTTLVGTDTTDTLTNKTLEAASNVINADTAVALAANGANCSAGNYPLGVDASGAVESCTAAGGGGSVSLLVAGSGTDTTATATNVATVAISGLTAKDQIMVHYVLESDVEATAAIVLYNATDSVKIAELTANTALNNSYGGGRARLMQMQSAATAWHSEGTGFRGDALVGWSSSLKSTNTTAWTGSWTLALRHGGVTATGTFRYVWAVYKIAGQ